MNGLERIKAAVAFAPPVEVPVIPQVFGHAAIAAGVPLEAYLRDGELLARCQLKALESYGHDAVFALMDVNVETEALGSVLRYRRNQYATIETYALARTDDFSRLSLPDPERAGRMPELLKAMRILRRELQNEVLIAGCVTGPLTLAAQLLGMETALYLAIDEPERFGRLLDFTTEVAIRFGASQIRAGAHLPIVFDPAASPAVVPGGFFREFALPRLKKIFSSFRENGATANWLHIAGPAGPILPFFPEAGVEIANFDYYIAPETALAALPGTCLDGNIKSLSFLASGAEEIRAEAESLLAAFAGRGGYILSPGCEIPLEARPENIRAMVTAAREAR
ncbi:MAG: uroporphyrinogen decarboxylase family protein [Deltaproteobacteria bacterium]|nr:uroporphyrinogen decarboxylase family protein [Deltaproteobacteria bacterium]